MARVFKRADGSIWARVFTATMVHDGSKVIVVELSDEAKAVSLTMDSSEAAEFADAILDAAGPAAKAKVEFFLDAAKIADAA